MQITKLPKIAALACLGSFLASSGYAAEVTFTPSVTVGTKYESNFWKSENDAQEVMTYSLRPGATINYKTGRTILDAGVFLNGYLYDDLSTPAPGVADANDDNYVGFDANLGVTTALTDRVLVSFNEAAAYTRDPAQADKYSDSTSREKYFLNDATLLGKYKFGKKFALVAAYNNLWTDYVDNGEDSLQNKGNFDLVYNLDTTSSVFVSYDVWHRDYKEASTDYLSNQVTLNYKKQFSYLALELGGGYHNRSYDDVAGQNTSDLDAFAWNIGLTGEDNTTEGGKPKSSVMVALSQNLNDAGGGDTYYLATRLDLDLKYRFLEKLSTGISGYFQNADYDRYNGDNNTNRKDDTYNIAVNFGYDFGKYSSLNLQVGYEDRDSNISGLSYNDTFAMLSLDFAL